MIIAANKWALSTETTLRYAGKMSKMPPAAPEPEPSPDVRQRIVAAAAALIAAGGPDAATTRAVATAASVQAPTIYRLFGDKRGLLDAVAEHALATYLTGKATRSPHPDPLQDLRDGWDMHIAFSLANPGLFSIISGDPHARGDSLAVAAGLEVLRKRVRRLALTGRLKVSETRAVALLQAMGNGTVLTLLSQPESARDPEFPAVAREAVISAIAGEPVSAATAGAGGAAMALRASLDDLSALTSGERHLLAELLDRVANGASR